MNSYLLVSTGVVHRHLLPGGGVDDGNLLPLPGQRGSPTWGPRMCWRSLERLLRLLLLLWWCRWTIVA